MDYKKIKNVLNKILPNFLFNILINIWRNTYVKLITKIKENSYKNLDNKLVFTKIYKENIWGSDESKSGPGSEYNLTKNIRNGIKKIIKDYKIKTFIDAPCGDVNWLEPEKLGVKYIGCDIVEELIESNKNKIINENIDFKVLDITKDNLPEGDIILCRECLQHLSIENINKFINNLKKSKIRYLLTTTHNSEKNIDIINGGYFTINLEIEPFNFPKPILEIEEYERNNITGESKKLGLWDISKI